MNACNIELQYRYKPRKKCCLDFSKHQRILIQFQSPNLGILALGKRNLTPRGSKNQPGFWRLQTTSGIAFKVPQEAGFHVSISSIKWKEKMSSGEGKERGGQGRQSKVKKKNTRKGHFSVTTGSGRGSAAVFVTSKFVTFTHSTENRITLVSGATLIKAEQHFAL
jgi:hypothetical protein